MCPGVSAQENMDAHSKPMFVWQVSELHKHLYQHTLKETGVGWYHMLTKTFIKHKSTEWKWKLPSSEYNRLQHYFRPVTARDTRFFFLFFVRAFDLLIIVGR